MIGLGAGASSRSPGGPPPPSGPFLEISISGALAALATDLGTAFDALEAYCGDRVDIPAGDGEFRRLDGAVSTVLTAIVSARSVDRADLAIKARLLLDSSAIRDDADWPSLVGLSLARDVLRLLGAPSNTTGG